MSDLSSVKAELRKTVLKERDALSVQEREMGSLAIKEHFQNFEIAPDAVVSAFLPIRSEVDLTPIIDDLLKQQIAVCLPFMLDKENIEFRTYGHDTNLIDNGFGTKAPADDEAVLEPDVMLVPLSAFDQYGSRMGYGAGFYDRAIARLIQRDRKPVLIGVAFSVQQVAEVPIEPHDIPLDMILTENGLRSF